jgi:hypothetical protein
MKLDFFAEPSAAIMAVHEAIAALPRKPVIQAAQAIARDAVKRHALAKMVDYVSVDLQTIYDDHAAMYGTGAPEWTREDWDEWEEPIIEALEAYFDGLPRELTSVTFRNTLDRRAPREAKAVVSLARDFAEEAWKCLTTHHNKENEDEYGKEKTAAQILSSVGVTTPDLQGLLDAFTEAPQPTKEPTTMYDTEKLLAEIREGAAMLGILDDDKQLTFALDNASDDDDGVASSGFNALCVEFSEDKANTLKMMRMTGGVDFIKARVLESEGAGDPVTDTVAEMPAAPPPAESTKTVRKKPAPATQPAVAETGVIPPFVLATLKEKTGVKAEELGLGVGASRTTFINYAAGKAKLVASPDNKAFIVKTLDDHINALTAARNLMDSV